MNSDKTSASSSYRDSLKSMDTEEHIDLAFYRPIGYMWACLAARLGVTPNAITIASIIIGIAAGVSFYFPQMWVNVIGMLLLVWANSFDSADGQLARMTKQYSRLGRILDGLSGDIWFATIYIAICLRENVTSTFFMAHPWLIWTIAAITGLCHAKQAAMADYYRQFHLYFLKGKDGAELEDASQLKRQIEKDAPKAGLWKRLTMMIYYNYTLQQEATAPAMQKLRHELNDRFPSGEVPQGFRDAFREKSLPLMKYTNILSFNWRTIALFVSLFLRMPWLYFIFELTVLNALLVYMVVRHERICKTFVGQLEDGKY